MFNKIWQENLLPKYTLYITFVHTRTHTHTHTHIYIYIYIYMCVCVCVCMRVIQQIRGFKKKIYFFRIVFHKRKLCIVEICFITKIILTVKNSCFEAMNKQTECSVLEQKSVIKSIGKEKSKTCRIYREMRDM